jgi:hypothetical protein
MIVDVVQEKVYVPKWNGNRELPESEQIRVTHRFLKAGERKSYIYLDDLKLDGEGKIANADRVYHQDEQGLVKALVTKIENLALNVDGKTVNIKTGAALYDTIGVPSALVVEIESYLLTATPEVDKDFLA